MTRGTTSRRTTLSRQVTAVAAAAVVVAVVVTGAVSVGLVRQTYDREARRTLHREAVLSAALADTPGSRRAVLSDGPAGQLLASAGVQVVRVTANGAVSGATGDPGLLARRDQRAAAQGRAVTAVRHLAGSRWFVDVEPVASGGGIVLLQPVTRARAVTTGVLRRLAAALVVGLAVASALAAGLAARLARPLVAAAAGARRLAAGERDVRVAGDGPREVADVAAALDALAAALRRSEGRQRDFLLSISHELRSPLTAVRGFAEALADGVAQGPAAQDAGRTILGESARLQRLVDDLLDLARLRADAFRLEVIDVDLSLLLAEAGRVWAHRAAGDGVELTVVRPPTPLAVRTDPVRVRQVVDGLVGNALRLTPAGRPVVLELRALPGAAVLEVRDGGPGLAQDDLAVAFEPLVLHERYRSTRPVGTGVGLALVAELVARLGGTVTAGHAAEGGAAFTVRLPA